MCVSVSKCLLGGQSACWPDVILNRCVLVSVSEDRPLLNHHHHLHHCHHDSHQQHEQRLSLVPRSLPLLRCILSVFSGLSGGLPPSSQSDSSPGCSRHWPAALTDSSISSPQVHSGYITVTGVIVQAVPSRQPGTCRCCARGSCPALRVLLCVWWTVHSVRTC